MVHLFKLFVLVSIATGYVRKEIPAHIAKTIGDPKIKHVAKHDISLDLIKSGGLIKRDPTRRKSIEEIPRVPEHEMHVEEISADTFHAHPLHIKSAEREHQVDMRSRLKKAFSQPDQDQMAEKIGGITPEEEALEVASIWGDRIPKPKNPDIHYLYNMILNIRIRNKWLDNGHPLESFMIGMGNELRVAEVDF